MGNKFAGSVEAEAPTKVAAKVVTAGSMDSTSKTKAYDGTTDAHIRYAVTSSVVSGDKIFGTLKNIKLRELVANHTMFW